MLCLCFCVFLCVFVCFRACVCCVCLYVCVCLCVCLCVCVFVMCVCVPPLKRSSENVAIFDWSQLMTSLKSVSTDSCVCVRTSVHDACVCTCARVCGCMDCATVLFVYVCVCACMRACMSAHTKCFLLSPEKHLPVRPRIANN